MSGQLDIVDIHTHLWPPAWGPGGKYEKKSFGFSDEIYRKITTPQALVDEFAAAGVSLAIVSATIESLFGAEGPVDRTLIPGVNDWLAELTASHPALAAFATIDAFAGDEAAREAERAIVDLGLAGLVIDSSRDGRFLGDPAVRPVLDAAARLKVPVFVHPVAHPDAEPLIAGAGTLGNSLGRGLMNGVALLSVLKAGILEAPPDLHLVFATLGVGAIVQASRGGLFGPEAWAQGKRPNVYFDTMGSDPRIIRVLADFFGADRVVAGTDWPILPALTGPTLTESLARSGLPDADRQLLAGGNARRLLGLRTRRAEAAE